MIYPSDGVIHSLNNWVQNICFFLNGLYLCCVLGFDILLSRNAWIRPCALHNCFRIRWTRSHTMIDNHNPSTAAKWSAMLMTRTKRIIRKKLLTRQKTKRKRWRLHSMTTEFRKKCAEKMVTEMFKDWMEQKPTWLYRDAYGNPGKDGARHIYPRFRLSLFLECLGEIWRKSVKSIYPINSFKGVVILPKSNVRF